jgi:hypothetical protein
MYVGIGVGIGRQRFAQDGFDSDYQAVLNYATTQGYTLPSAGQQIKQNKLIVDLKAAGIWAKLDSFGVFATDGNSNFALIDWKRLVNYTAVNSPVFSSNGGFTGNGTSSYIDTNYNPATNGVNYTLNNAGRFFWVDNRAAGNWEGGTSAAGNNSLNASSTGHRINSNNVLSSAANFAMDGFHAINRTSLSNVELFTGTTQFSRLQVSTGIQSSNSTILRSGTAYNASRFRFYGIGAEMVSENTDFNNALNTYFTSL